MIAVAFYLALSCPEPKIINDTKYPWNAHDKETEETCQKRCPDLYTDAICLKTIRKYDKQDYDCICGKP